MKAIYCDGSYFSYPEGIENLEELIAFLNANYHSFVKLKRWSTTNCRSPYFIATEVEDVYLNVAEINEITEEEVTVLSKEEYDRRLMEIVKKKCIHCANYEEGDLTGHHEKLSLDGECYFFQKK